MLSSLTKENGLLQRKNVHGLISAIIVTHRVTIWCSGILPPGSQASNI